jgi:putative membrane protein insertion efficiency factor
MTRLVGGMCNAMARAAVWVIRLYQRTLSRVLPPSCRFYPSCSEYAVGCIQRFGLLRGLALSVWRVLRCNPFNPGGYDPVPGTGDDHGEGSDKASDQ